MASVFEGLNAISHHLAFADGSGIVVRVLDLFLLIIKKKKETLKYIKKKEKCLSDNEILAVVKSFKQPGP